MPMPTKHKKGCDYQLGCAFTYLMSGLQDESEENS